MSRWQFWVDRGGTFTDLVARTPTGSIKTAKLLSDNPQHYPDAVVQGICDLMRVSAIDAIPVSQIASVRLGTTVATNALLERKGAPTLLVTTKGFGDALRIGYQNRPELFALNIQLPEPLYCDVLEVDERLDADGEVLTALDAGVYEPALRAARAAGITAVAVVFMHAYRNPVNEQRFGDLARTLGFAQVTLSHEVSSLIKFVSRGETAVVDAYVAPVLRQYIDQLASTLSGVELLFMQSSGGLAAVDKFRGCNSLLSGPAGGVVGGAGVSGALGYKNILGFDMGGTSTDVWHFAGTYERVYEANVAGARMRVPMMDIHTVAAGGGSICYFDGSKLRVGPESAGANPGPACYGRGGPLTITDCNLALGKLDPAGFPTVFGDSGRDPVAPALAEAALRALATEVLDASGRQMSVAALAEGFVDIANEGMAGAIKKISTQRGHDTEGYALACFGGAAGQHACRVAEHLGVDAVLSHPLAGVLSALGMGLATVSASAEQSLDWPLDQPRLADALAGTIRDLQAQALRQLPANCDRQSIVWSETVHIRYAGANTVIGVPRHEVAQMRAMFEQLHRDKFSFVQSGQALLVDSVVVEGTVPGATAMAELAGVALEPDADEVTAAPTPIKPLFCRGEWRNAALLSRRSLCFDQVVVGPALIVDDNATTVVESAWQARVLKDGTLLLTRQAGTELTASGRQSSARDPVRLEIFNYRFMAIAEQMGAVLAHTAHSVNIKERLDFSCALFDGHGALVANAPHVPVHLGSMSETVQQLISNRRGTFVSGDAYLLNSPYAGGTHLPDLTVVSPVHIDEGEAPAFYVATRAHHADIGGVTPGSIPPDSITIEEEGVLFEDFHLVEGGVLQGRALTDRLLAEPWPARNVAQNIADIQAQIAANTLGARALQSLVNHYGRDVVTAYMGYVQDNAAEAVGKVIASLADGRFRYAMDNGACVEVAVRVDRQRERLHIDFAGTSAQQKNNFNAPVAVCKAAVLYVLRTLVADNIPLNAGCLRGVDMHIPDGSMLNPRFPAAVVAGNVETSQYIADAIYGALGVLAGSQGTMNNVVFGDASDQYYETICGGAGAGDGFGGASGVQVHMTNSRLTDPEVLEARFPVRLEAFCLRRGSGGAGQYRGGDGVVRRLRFLRPLAGGIVSGHRRLPTFGLNGGGAGKPGINSIVRVTGDRERLPGTAKFSVNTGDVLVVATPGGGGFGQLE